MESPYSIHLVDDSIHLFTNGTSSMPHYGILEFPIFKIRRFRVEVNVHRFGLGLGL